ncbi:dihydroorotate dehydrogenase [Tumebacillus sp. BK434]|uniref:dihydroorotate dehydrogenase n=1 Tax=Tumebacillus sp. BK434 TaxID=2512169 RepID=UPI0010459D85|nr:dihydroorotate dehydrogenase [Tumebacillus sp. BK434]TCP52162.1 dihydroorotate dehydrogenase [Tumebacillus sp. BK434]
MPDWSYHPLFKPLLFRMPAAKARSLTLRAIGTLNSLPGGYLLIELMGHMKPEPELRRTVWGREFSAPVGLSGRIDPELAATGALGKFGFGFLEVGPGFRSEVSLDTAGEAVVYGAPLPELDEADFVQRLERHRSVGVPLAVRAGRGQDAAWMQRMEKYAALFLFEGTEEEYRAAKASVRVPVVVVVQGDLPAWPELDGVYLEEPCGRVGREGTTRALELLRAWKAARPDVPVLAGGGVYEPQDALDLYAAGADLVMLDSGFVFSGPGLPKRINEAVLDERLQAARTGARVESAEGAEGAEGDVSVVTKGGTGWLSWFLMGCGVFFAGMIAMLVGLTDVILAHDEQFLGLTREEIAGWSEELFHFMSHDRITLAGIMLSAGFLFAQLAWHKIRRGERWAVVLFAAAAGYGFLNFLYSYVVGYIDSLHVIYNLLILPFFLWGLVRTRELSTPHGSLNRRNTKAWKKGLVGQLMFVVLGAALLTAGVVISAIGMTGVFVPEDLAYMGLTPEQIHEYNHRLIPLIAHDRAGFGGSLITEGLLLLLISLWGYRQGESWLWWSYLIGGFFGLAAGIGVHVKILYTDFWHLLPAYIALALYLVGLICSHEYLRKTKPPV